MAPDVEPQMFCYDNCFRDFSNYCKLSKRVYKFSICTVMRVVLSQIIL